MGQVGGANDMSRSKKQEEQFDRFRAKGCLRATQTMFTQLAKISHFPIGIRMDFAHIADCCRFCYKKPYFNKKGKKK
jgi:hypothetical protein